MKMSVLMAFNLALALGFIARGEAVADRVYRQVAFNLGTVERSATDITKGSAKCTVVPTTATLVCPGLTVADLVEGSYCVNSFFCGSAVGGDYIGLPAHPVKLQTHKNDQQVIDKAISSHSIVEYGNNTYVKSVAVEYTNGEGGVYARAFSARYTPGTELYTTFVTMDDNGDYTYSEKAGTVATSWKGATYGLAGLAVCRFVRSDMILPVWSNDAGEPQLTLEDIKDYELHGFMTGPKVNSKGGLAEGFNKHFLMDESGVVTNMTVEFQMLDDQFVKCVIVDFANGTDGIVARARTACYKSISDGAALGFRFLDNGIPGGRAVALGWVSSWGDGNYGVYELTATPPTPEVALELNASKSWTELVGNTDLGARELKVKITVTGENPVLTFDAALDRAQIAFSGVGAPGAFTLKGTESAFTLDELEVGSSLRLNMDHGITPTTVTLGDGATIVYAPEGEATVRSAISGNGGVEIASGDITMKNSASDYTGGTLVKNGATIRPGGAGSVRGQLYIGPFGVANSGNPVTVEPGGCYDVSGVDGAHCWVAGQGVNPVVNTGVPLNHNCYQTWGLILTGDMVLDMANEFGLITANRAMPGGVHLNGHTLVKKGSAPFSMAGNNMNITGEGTLHVQEGPFTVVGNGAMSGSEAKLLIDSGVTVTNCTDIILGAIENNGTIVFVPREATNEIQTSTYTGSGTLVVASANNRMARLSFYSGPGRRYVVKSGRASPAVSTRPSGNPYAFNTAAEPLLNQRVDVESGATFDLAGISDVNVSVTIAGTGYDGKGALVNTGKDLGTGMSQIVQLTLADDATVGGTSMFAVLAPSHQETRVELGTHTLSIDTDKYFAIENTTISGTGGFDVKRGTLYFYPRDRGLRYDEGATMDIRIREGGVLDNDMALTVRNFENAGVVTNDAPMITVTGTVTGTGEAHAIPRLTLADGATIKVTDAAAPLAVAKTLVASGRLTVDLEGFERKTDDAAIPLLAAPAGTDLSSVTYEARNLPVGGYLSVRNGIPCLKKGGLVINFH